MSGVNPKLTVIVRSLAILFIALAVTALRVAGCGGFGGKTASEPSEGTAPSGATTYVGTTDQGREISFAATSSAVFDLSFGWSAPCADGKVRSNSIDLGGAAIHDGTFSFGGVLETGGVAQVEGKIDGDIASGTFSRSRGTAFGIDCKVTDVAWEAHAEPPSGQAS